MYISERPKQNRKKLENGMKEENEGRKENSETRQKERNGKN